MKIRLGSMEVRLSRYLGLWAVVVVVFAAQGCVNDAVNGHLWSPGDYLRWWSIQWLTWAGLAPLVFRLGERHPIPFPPRLSALARHVGYSLAVTLLAVVIGALVSTLFEPSSFGQQLIQFISKHYAIGLLAYWTLLAVQQLLHFQAEKSRREIEATRLATELAQSRLQVLKTQLQPHFLFNTLHAIITLLDEDTLSAEDMLLRLSELLRAFLEEYDGQEITLERELALLDLYLGIQRKRYGDRLSTQIYVAPGTLHCAVPSLVLQPLVENAIRHGVSRRSASGLISIRAAREGQSLHIEVQDDGPGFDVQGAPGGRGLGLANTSARLEQLYGDRAELHTGNAPGGGARVALVLPYHPIA